MLALPKRRPQSRSPSPNLALIPENPDATPPDVKFRAGSPCPVAPIAKSSRPSIASLCSIDSGIGRMSSGDDIITRMSDPNSTKNFSTLTAKTSFNDKAPRAPITSICLVGSCANDSSLHDILAAIHVKVLASETGTEFIEQEHVAFVIEEFEGAIFDRLFEAKRTIYGPTAVREFCATKEIYRSRRPLYCRSMDGIVACFSGFGNDKASVLSELVNLIHYMGGSVRQKYGANVTHVVSATTQSEKYRLAVAAGIPIMSEEWVRKAWEKRSIKLMNAFNDEMKLLKLPAFYGLKLAFHNIPLDEKLKMETRTAELGGQVVEPVECTHLVVGMDDRNLFHDNPAYVKPNEFCRTVSIEWFWTSAHLDICANEDAYPAISKQSKNPMSPSSSESPRPSSISWSRPSTRRRSSSSTNAAMNSAAAHHDNMHDTTCMLDEHMFSVDDLESFMKSPSKSGVSKRQLVCVELLQTESSYLKKLHQIVSIFKEPCEKTDPYGNRLLSPIEVKTIFLNVHDIIDVHEKIQRDLSTMIVNWNEKSCVGRVYLEYKEDLKKSYKPYMNYFPNAKETLAKCIKKNQRFSDFLTACRGKPELEKKCLDDLLICPVQRLASVVLLFVEIKKRTDKSHEDYNYLQQVIDALNEVLTTLNEDKRKTETYTQMFEIVKEIERCPPHLLSSQRQLIAQIDASDLSGHFCKKKSSILSFFLFNDCLEFAKRTPRAQKKHEHKDLYLLPRIRRIINVSCADESVNLFCLTIRNNMCDTDYVFSFLGNSSSRRASVSSTGSIDLKLRKIEFLEQLTNQIISTTDRSGFHCEQCHIDGHANSENATIMSIQNALKRLHADEGSLKRTVSVKSTGSANSGFRRSISHAMMNFASGTLRRMSRSNLRMPLHNIVEEAAANLSKTSKNDSSLMIGN